MKYLLSILILFSGLSLSDEIKRLICDKPYIFFPDYEEREVVRIDMNDEPTEGSYLHVRSIYGDEIFDFKDYLIEPYTISWMKDTDSTDWIASLDRITLKLTYRGFEPKQCKIAQGTQWIREMDRLEKILKNDLDKRKI